jgi:hypothetical protein
MKLYVIFYLNDIGQPVIVDSYDSREQASKFVSVYKKDTLQVLCKGNFKRKYPEVFAEYYNNLNEQNHE